MVRSILMVDDGSLTTSWLIEILQRERYDVEAAYDEKEAVRLYSEHRHDLIVADVRIPETLEMLADFNEIDPEALILVIVADELVQPDSVLNVTTMFGPVRVLRKPFSLETFLRTVEEQISRSR
jgi:DNA-binding NtrC family response regulator